MRHNFCLSFTTKIANSIVDDSDIARSVLHVNALSFSDTDALGSDIALFSSGNK